MTEFITRGCHAERRYEIIIKTDNEEHYYAAQAYARLLIDHQKPQTNADRIRAMSDEELAAELCKSSVYGEKCYECNLNGGGCDTHFGTEACVSIVLEWLKQPSEEEDDA